MSNFYCDKCGAICSEDDSGRYATGCEHYPPDADKWLSRDCEIYTGRCSCEPGQPRCIPQ